MPENPTTTTTTTAATSIDDDLALLATYNSSIKADLLRPASGILTRPYLSAGLGNTYPDLTDWDAIWAGAAYLINGDPEPLRASLLGLIEHIQPDGKGQRRIGKNGYSAPPFQIRPFLAAGCFVLSRETDDITWLGDEGLDAVEHYLFYRHNHRTGRDGLITWLHIDEGFGDNGVGNWAWEPSCVQGVDLNAQLCFEHICFAWLADKAGEPRRAARHRRLARRLREGIDNLLWDPESEHYYSLYIPPRRSDRSTWIRTIFAGNLWPLWVGIAEPERARRVIERYVLDSEHYWSSYGIRSLSRSERHYNNARRGINMPTSFTAQQGPAIDTATCSNMQGPVWSFQSYFAVSYLSRYGYADRARQVAETMVRQHARMLRETGAYWENIDAETGCFLTAKGIASWCLMAPQAWQTALTGHDWWFRGLDELAAQ